VYAHAPLLVESRAREPLEAADPAQPHQAQGRGQGNEHDAAGAMIARDHIDTREEHAAEPALTRGRTDRNAAQVEIALDGLEEGGRGKDVRAGPPESRRREETGRPGPLPSPGALRPAPLRRDRP
jgi:hypothetical protein